MTNEKELTHIDLFSGIGGFTLAGEWAGFRTIVFCEKEKFCQKVLKKHWPEIPIIEEIRDFNGKKYRGATLLTGGFPCQPFSHAGKRKGKEDDRYLWPEMLRVISEAKPHWILAENVFGIFRMALDTVLTDLEREGYTTGTFIIPACNLNAPHRRNRVWIIANSRPLGRNEGTEETRNKRANNFNNLCQKLYANYTVWDRHGEKNKISAGGDGIIGTNKDASNSKSRNSRQQETRNRWEGFERGSWQKNWHEVATRFCRVDDGVPDRVHRLKALGNAIVPQIAYEILKNIAWIENELA